MKNASQLAALVCVAVLCQGSLRAAQANTTSALHTRGAPVRTTLLVVDVEIQDGVATTTLAQTIVNDGARPAEAIWLLPLPIGAVADEFKMTVDGVEMAGDVLRSEDARGVYERIVRERRDPGLLEYAGRGCLRARVFPIPPKGRVLVEAVFRQVLPTSGGLYHWNLALAAAGVGGLPPEQVVLDLTVRSKRPIKNVYSPSARAHVIEKGDHEARVSYESLHGEAEELDLFYGLSEKEFGLDLLSTRASGEKEGTFLMLLSPKQEWSDLRIQKKSLTFIVDTSGSMQGVKLEQAKGALRFFLDSLDPQDRFNVVPFSTESEPFFKEPVAATVENLGLAQSRVQELEARGGTNISNALDRGLIFDGNEPGRVPIVVFLTDGTATVGLTDTGHILARARACNLQSARIFVFGVGTKVNTHFLDKLAADSGGARDYVREDESIEVKTSALFTKLSHPVMTDLQIQVEGVELTRVVPAALPDLFRGSRLQVFGRYRETGTHAVRLTGTVDGEPHEYIYEGAFAAEPVLEHEFVPPLWAERRVGVLLDAMRLNGTNPELVNEVRRLGIEHHIVTPYTSHLIVEEGLRVGARSTGGGAGSGAPGSPGPSGPSSPGSSGPSTPGAVTTGSEGFFLGHRTVRRRPPSLESIVLRLREAGVLPAEASQAELEKLAIEIALELGAAREGLADLGKESSGTPAIEASQYLSRLMSGQLVARPGGLIALFTRKVKDKVFVLRGGVWTDRALDEEEKGPRQTVEAYSEAYFALLRAEPELGRYFAFSPRMIVVLKTGIFEVTPAPDE